MLRERQFDRRGPFGAGGALAVGDSPKGKEFPRLTWRAAQCSRKGAYLTQHGQNLVV